MDQERTLFRIYYFVKLLSITSLSHESVHHKCETHLYSRRTLNATVILVRYWYKLRPKCNKNIQNYKKYS